MKGNKSPPPKAITSALFAFVRRYLFRTGFLDGKVDPLIAVIQMQYISNNYVFLLIGHRLAGVTNDAEVK